MRTQQIEGIPQGRSCTKTALLRDLLRFVFFTPIAADFRLTSSPSRVDAQGGLEPELVGHSQHTRLYRLGLS